MDECGNCENSVQKSKDGVFCRLFGIMIHKNHRGCKYHKPGVRANGTTENTESEEGLDA